MSQFSVKPERLDQCAGNMNRIGRDIGTAISILDDINVYSCLNGLSARKLDADIKKTISNLHLQKKEMDGFASALNRISYNYKYTENKLCDRPVFSYRGPEDGGGTDPGGPGDGRGHRRKKGDGPGPMQGRQGDPYVDVSGEGSEEKDDNSWSDALIKGSNSQYTEIGGVVIGSEVAGELIGASTDASFESGVKFKDDKLDSISLIEVNASGEVHGAKGKVSGTIGPISTSAEGTVGKVKAEGSVGITLYEDGEFAPHLGFEAEASATAIEGKAEASIGDENFDIHRSVSGKVGTARAKANAGIGKVTYEDDDGNKKTGYGGAAEVKAEAYAAEGKVKGGVNIFGIDIDVGVTGKAGGAGIKAGGHATSGGVGVSLGAGLGLGLGLDLNVDWTGFKWGW